MNKDTDMLKNKIKQAREKLQTKFDKESVFVQPGSMGGLNIKIVSNEFKNIPFDRRIENILCLIPELEKDDVSFIELLTEEENKLFGTDLKDLEVEDLPFWVERVNREMENIQIKTINDDTYSIELPFITTFYSIKGGVGRTTAMAYVAHLLANQGKVVVAIDFDLEAPGLPSILDVEQEVKEGWGLLEYLRKVEFDQERNIKEHLIKVESNINPNAELYLLPAGKFGIRYLELLDNLNLKLYYRWEANPLHILIDEIKKEMKPDVILIDARTGMTPSNAPLLFDLSDMAILFFYPNAQTRPLLKLLIDGLMSAKTRRGFTPEFRFVLSPLPETEIKDGSMGKKGEKYMNELYLIPYEKQIRESIGELDIKNIFTPIIYDKKIIYSDTVKEDLSDYYSVINNWIENYISNGDTTDYFSKEEKNKLLDSIDIIPRIAEQKNNFDWELRTNEINKLFIKTKNYKNLTSKDKILIRGRQGSGKTHLFLYYLHNWKEKELGTSYPFLSPPGLKLINNPLTKEDFIKVNQIIQSTEKTWKDFWEFAIFDYIQKANFSQDNHIKTISSYKLNFDKDIMNYFKNSKQSFISNIVNIDRTLQYPLTLLFDGLDTIFGLKEEETKTRNNAISGLLELLQLLDKKINKIYFKIFLREDIWANLDFQNKSHFLGREITLFWEQDDYFRTLMKELSKNIDFINIFKEKIKVPLEEVEELQEKSIEKIISLMVGEKIKGLKGTKVRDWIWEKLADANGDHSPLNLQQLFQQAIKKENEIFESEKENGGFLKSIIRPGVLIQVYPQVSRLAVESLREEYQEELNPLFDFLKDKYSPIDISELKQLPGYKKYISIAESAGIIGKYKREPDRYFIPDLYLKGLNMKRKGQL